MTAFRETVTDADGAAAEGTCSEAHALALLRRAVRLGYRVEATRHGGAVIAREIPAGTDQWSPPRTHTVTLEPVTPAGTVTAANRIDLGIIDRRGGLRRPAQLNHGRIDAGLNSIPPAAAARLIDRGLVTVDGTTVTVSLIARLAMVAQDHRTETSEPRGYHREQGVIGPWRKGGCVYDRSSAAHCECRWSYPAEDRDDARRRAREHRQQAAAAMLADLLSAGS